MLAAIPSAKVAGFQADAIAEGTETSAHTTKMQESSIKLLHAAPASGAWLLESGLTIVDRDNKCGLQRERTSRDDGRWPELPHVRRAGRNGTGQVVSPFVSRGVSLKNQPRQRFKAYCLGHCLARVSIAARVSRCLAL
jgi:hypothetical protein